LFCSDSSPGALSSRARLWSKAPHRSLRHVPFAWRTRSTFWGSSRTPRLRIPASLSGLRCSAPIIQTRRRTTRRATSRWRAPDRSGRPRRAPRAPRCEPRPRGEVEVQTALEVGSADFSEHRLGGERRGGGVDPGGCGKRASVHGLAAFGAGHDPGCCEQCRVRYFLSTENVLSRHP
jgi:hypothetical protein